MTAQLAGAVEYTNYIWICIKQTVDEATVLNIWEIPSTPSLPLLPDPLWPGVVTPDKVLSMGQRKQTIFANK